MTAEQQQEAITALAALLARHQQHAPDHTHADQQDPAETSTDPDQ